MSELPDSTMGQWHPGNSIESEEADLSQMTTSMKIGVAFELVSARIPLLSSAARRSVCPQA